MELEFCVRLPVPREALFTFHTNPENLNLLLDGWKFTGTSGWDYDIETPPPSSPATYYFEAPSPFDKSFTVKVPTSPGTPSNPMEITIIAECSVLVSGNPTIAPDSTRGDDIGIITGGDLVISGNGSNEYAGFYGAHEQILINGNPDMVGSFIAEDADFRYEDVKGNAIDISGNPRITYAPMITQSTESVIIPTRVRIEGYLKVR